MRPLLKPALRRVWRDGTTLQIGLDPDRAVVITGLDAASVQLVESLDGTRDLTGVLARARAVGLEESRAARLLDLLAHGDVLDDAAAVSRPTADLDVAERDRLAPDLAALSLVQGRRDGGAAALARRRRANVAVHGAGRVGAAVAVLLAAAGVGRLDVTDAEPVQPGDLGPAGVRATTAGERRHAAVRATVRDLAPGTRTDRHHRQPADVAVLAPPDGAPDPRVVDDLVRAGTPHLLATVRETLGVTGPLVLPGRSPCLRCLDLHRTDRDPGWPRVAAQLVASSRPSSTAACDVVLATAVAAQAALQVLLLLDGTTTPPAVGGTLETSGLDGRTRRRSWPPHPACGCRW